MQTHATTLFLFIAVSYNAVVFTVYGWDKAAARAGRQRISEATLLALALVGGSPGAVLAHRLLRHKTRKQPFRRHLTAILIIHMGITACVIAYVLGD